MNIEQEIRAQIEKNKGLKLAVGEINNHLSILEGLLRNERDDVQKQVNDAYQRGLEEGKKATWGLVADASSAEYQRGLDDAWEAARRISILESDGGYSWKEMKSIFGTDSASEIYVLHTATEAINKIKAYEEKQKADDEIKVRDEVVWTQDENVAIVVTNVYTVDNMEWCDGVCKDGKVYHILTKNARKTGRHFDIEKILKEMDE